MDLIYENYPLDDTRGDIRLLYFQQRNESHDPEIIECSLVVFPLDEAPPYAALSYVWGAPDFSEQFKVDGTPVQITENLLHALTSFVAQIQTTIYDSSISTGSISFLWVDALCINQLDTKEKTTQVQKMGQIYANANFVWAWLGSSSPANELVIKECNQAGRKLCSIVPAMYRDGMDLLDDSDHFMPEDLVHVAERNIGSEFKLVLFIPKRYQQRHLLTLIDELGWLQPPTQAAALLHGAWQEFCGQEFWTRIWILQEVVLGQTVYLASGTVATRLEDLLIIWSVITRASLHPHRHNFLTSGVINYTNGLFNDGKMINTILALRLREPHIEIDIIALVTLTSLLRATEAKDRVYGLLGISSDVKTLGFSADYTLSFHEACTDLAKRLIMNYGVAALTYTVNDLQIISVPSWVTFYPLLEFPEKLDYNLNSNFEKKVFQFSSSGETTQSFDEESFVSSLILKVRGFSVDIVFMAVFPDAVPLKVSASSSPQDPWIYPDILQIVDNLALGATKRCKRAVEDRHLAPIWWLPVLHRDPKAAPLSRREAFRRESDELYKSYLALRAYYDHKKGSQNKAIAPEAKLYQKTAGDITRYQTFFNTEEHGFLGVGPNGLKTGDKIVIPCGAEMPLAIRPSGDGEHFLLLGDVYVLGIMHGEFLARDPAIEEFLLK